MTGITVLNVAEKNSVAKEVSRLLCNGRQPQQTQSRKVLATYCKNFEFPFHLQGRQVQMIFSSVAGHLLELEFKAPYNKWNGCRPVQLYDAPVEKGINTQSGENKKIAENLSRLARRAQWLILWLDCDREGENISFEVIKVCREANPNLHVRRARFSALIARDIFHAINNLVEPNANESAAVDVRQEIDLRIGSSFTRLQTLLLQDKFDWKNFLSSGRDRMLLSYGPCQFPTLGLIVRREWEIQSHIAENFWTIKLFYRDDKKGSCEFLWDRGRLFDKYVVESYHNECLSVNTATVLDTTGYERRKPPPFPLCTLELQKRASQALRIPGERIMKLAEEMYQSGYISYPRTETTIFAQGYDLLGMISNQADSGQPWSEYSRTLLGPQGRFRWPRSGGKDDGAHPPIHPTKPFDSGIAKQGNPSSDRDFNDKKRLYEFIARYFIACCSPDAEGKETKVTIEIAGEIFTAKGLMVTARNWLDVYPYTSWGGSGSLPYFECGQSFVPSEIKLHEGRTQPPPRMHEADLLAKMDEYGIGTDATVADHIAKQLERGYAIKDEATHTFAPTPLGEALISAYRKMGLENLWLPNLRGNIEQNIAAVALGIKRKDEVLSEAIRAFRRDFESAMSRSNILEQEVREIVFRDQPLTERNNLRDNGTNVNGNAFENQTLDVRSRPIPQNLSSIAPSAAVFGRCTCSHESLLVLVPAGDGSGPTVMCTAIAALHGWRKDFPPRTTQNVTISDELCERCRCEDISSGPCIERQVYKLNFTFSRALLPPMFAHLCNCTRCVYCDQEIHSLLETIGSGPRRQFRPMALSGRGDGIGANRSSSSYQSGNRRNLNRSRRGASTNRQNQGGNNQRNRRRSAR